MATTLNGLRRIMAERGCCCFTAEQDCWAYPDGGSRARAALPASAVELIPAEDGASVTEYRIIGAERVAAIYRDALVSWALGAFERVGLCEYDLAPCAAGLDVRFPIEQIGYHGERHRLYAEVLS